MAILSDKRRVGPGDEFNTSEAALPGTFAPDKTTGATYSTPNMLLFGIQQAVHLDPTGRAVFVWEEQVPLVGVKSIVQVVIAG